MQKDTFSVWALKTARIIVKTLLIGLIAVVLAGACAWVLLKRNAPAYIESKIGELVASRGLDVSIQGMDIALFPFPCVTLSGVRFRKGQTTLSMPWTTVEPDLLRLFAGSVMPGKVQLASPELKGRLVDLAPGPEDQAGARESSGPSPSLRDVLSGIFADEFNLVVNGADVILRDQENHFFYLADFSCDLAFDSSLKVEGTSNFRIFAYGQDRKASAVVDHGLWKGRADIENPAHGDSSFQFSGSMRFWRKLRLERTVFNFAAGPESSLLTSRIEGNLNWENVPIPLFLKGSLILPKQQGEYLLNGTQWKMGEDSGTIRGRLTVPEDFADAGFSGNLAAHRLSLTRWFGFARNLPPGLQISLDNLFDVAMDFSIDRKKLEARDIQAVCNGSLFKGTGGVADFEKPVVFLDLEAEKANLGQALGESLGLSPQEPWFAHEPLTPVPTGPTLPGELEIGFDIRLGAKSLEYGPLTLNDAFLRISPGKLDDDGLRDVLLAGEAGFYEGTLTGSCVLGGPDSLPITISGSAMKVNAARLAKDLPVFPIDRGRLQASANVKSESKILKTFLAKLNGQIKASGQNIGMGKDLSFAELELKSDVKTSSLEKDGLVMDAAWGIAFTAKPCAGMADLSGKIRFDDKGAAFAKLPLSFKLTMKETIPGFALKGSGQATLNSAKNEFAFSAGRLDAPGIALQASGEGNYKKASVEGSFNTTSLQPERLLAALGIKNVKLPAALLPASVKSKYKAAPDSVNLTGMTAKLGQTTAQGSLSCDIGGSTPLFQFNLQADRLDVAAFDTGASNPRKIWDFSFLKHLDLKGVLKIASLQGWDFRLNDLSLPLEMKNGILNVKQGAAGFYGGKASLNGSVNFASPVKFDLRLSSNGVNLGEVAKAQKLKLVIKGTGELTAHLTGQAAKTADFPAALNGSCAFRAVNGYWQSLDKKGQPDGKPTDFSQVQASGVIRNGRIITEDFSLKAPIMEIGGKGYTDLVKKELDYTLNVNRKGVPDFPLYIYGPFSKPKTNIGAGKLVLNAIGGIATGIGNMFGAIGQGIGSLFKSGSKK